MKTLYQEAARDDLVRQFRYYLITLNLRNIALRFRNSIQRTIQFLRTHPETGPLYSSADPKLKNLRSWPVWGFETTRIYYRIDQDTLHIIRILHGKRDVKRILQEGE